MSTTEPSAPEPIVDAVPPVTGHPAIDEALTGLSLGDDVHAHHDAITGVLDVVQRALNPVRQPHLPLP